MDSQNDKIYRLEQEVGAAATSDRDDREVGTVTNQRDRKKWRNIVAVNKNTIGCRRTFSML